MVINTIRNCYKIVDDFAHRIGWKSGYKLIFDIVLMCVFVYFFVSYLDLFQKAQITVGRYCVENCICPNWARKELGFSLIYNITNNVTNATVNVSEIAVIKMS